MLYAWLTAASRNDPFCQGFGDAISEPAGAGELTLNQRRHWHHHENSDTPSEVQGRENRTCSLLTLYSWLLEGKSWSLPSHIPRASPAALTYRGHTQVFLEWLMRIFVVLCNKRNRRSAKCFSLRGSHQRLGWKRNLISSHLSPQQPLPTTLQLTNKFHVWPTSFRKIVWYLLIFDLSAPLLSRFLKWGLQPSSLGLLQKTPKRLPFTTPCGHKHAECYRGSAWHCHSDAYKSLMAPAVFGTLHLWNNPESSPADLSYVYSPTYWAPATSSNSQPSQAPTASCLPSMPSFWLRALGKHIPPHYFLLILPGPVWISEYPSSTLESLLQSPHYPPPGKGQPLLCAPKGPEADNHFFLYFFNFYHNTTWGFLGGSVIKDLPAMRVQSLGQEDPLEEEMAIHFSNPAWKIPWAEEPGHLQSMGLQRVRHDSARTQMHGTTLHRKCAKPQYINSVFPQGVMQLGSKNKTLSGSQKPPPAFFTTTLENCPVILTKTGWFSKWMNGPKSFHPVLTMLTV